MTMTPIPDMKPETTTYGVYATKRPILARPRSIWSRPPRTTTVSASVRSDAWVVRMTVMATVIGAVGPEIWDLVPPNTAAKKPTAIAPWRPATAPMPEATPSARATGRATTVAVNAPNRSPRKVATSYLTPEALRSTVRPLFLALPCASSRDSS